MECTAQPLPAGFADLLDWPGFTTEPPPLPGSLAETYRHTIKTVAAEVWERPTLGPLRYHFGPTAKDNDPGKMWCYDCHGEVCWLYHEKPHGSYICLRCGRTAKQ